jgi:hypothetical protein
MAEKTAHQYILLPPRGLSAGDVVPSTSGVSSFFTSLETVLRATAPARALSAEKIKTKMTVIDSIHENGAKLVEMSPESVSDLQAEQPGLRIVPVVYYYPAENHVDQRFNSLDARINRVERSVWFLVIAAVIQVLAIFGPVVVKMVLKQ